MDTKNLLKVYLTVILPSVEYCSEIYSSLIPSYLSDKLESVQKQCMKIIYGWNINYQEMVDDGTIQTLASRREEACLRFANRAAASERFSDRWFPRNTASRDARPTTRRKYEEKKHKTERSRSNPIQNMIRLLNLQSSD